MKIIDKLLIKSFFPPFVVTLFIAIFVLVMQQVWVYLEDMAGKGASLFLLTEMLGYMSVSLLPMALPIAVLLSSVMVLGNFAERYELSSLKSAGVALWRVMVPLVAVATGIGIFSFFCSDKLIPITNLQSKSRLYDIRNQKPTLSLQQGVFNDDFQGFSIRIGKKDKDGTSIKDVLMYDQSQASNGKYTMVKSKQGQMFSTSDEKYFIMNLEDGHQFSEMKSSNTKDGKSYPFMRTSFKRWTKVFDLNEFQIDRTDTGLFESHYSMLSVRKLKVAIDSIAAKEERRKQGLAFDVNRSYHQRHTKQQAVEKAKREKLNQMLEDSLITLPKKQQEELEYFKKVTQRSSSDTSAAFKEKQAQFEKELAVDTRQRIPLDSLKIQQARKSKKNRVQHNQRAIIKQLIAEEDLTSYNTLLATFPEKNRKQLLNKAKSFTRGVQGSVTSVKRALVRIEDSRRNHRYTLHYKFSLAASCIIFLFIGAPMGAIVRKGGFGYPILISICFFVIFVMLSIFFKKVSEGGSLDAALAAWMPCLIFSPLGIFLTYKAMNDSKILNVDRYFAAIKRIYTRFAK